jgi:IS1 family transposase
VDTVVVRLVVEGIGLRGVARALQIGVNTVTRIILKAAAEVTRPLPANDQLTLEVDELWTYVGRKDNEYWVAYALDRKTREVVDFVIGKRTKGTLKLLIDRLLLLRPLVIRTDKLTIYQRIIPKCLHRAGAYLVNRIERKNLSLRTHLKRLSRKTICFSRSATLLESCLKLYFWR